MLWNSLEVPQWGTSNEFPQHTFLWLNIGTHFLYFSWNLNNSILLPRDVSKTLLDQWQSVCDLSVCHICSVWSTSSFVQAFLPQYSYSKTCVREPPLRLTLNSGWCGKVLCLYKGTCHVILLAKLHDMYLYKTTTFPHQPLRSISKVALLHRFYCRLNSVTIFLISPWKHILWILIGTQDLFSWNKEKY